MARYGRHAVWQSNWSEDGFREAQARAAAHHPVVSAEIDGLVASIAQLVPQLKPERALLRSWWEMADKQIKVESESEMDSENALALRMIDYIQSVIASVPAEANQREPTEEDWKALTTSVRDLFVKLNTVYPICVTATRRGTPGFEIEFEEFRTKAQLCWVNVRGHRHQVHDPIFLREVFLQHSDVLQELFDVTGEEFVEGLTSVWRSLSFGLGDSFLELDAFRQDTLDAVERKLPLLELGDNRDMSELVDEVVLENGWEERRELVFQRAFGLDLFDLKKTTNLPDKLLDELSWRPGEEQDFFALGDQRGWPLRIWPVARRPFLKVDGTYYCFDLWTLFDNIYRVMQRAILRLKPTYSERWKLEQTALSENLPIDYLTKLLPGAKVWRATFYEGDIANGRTGWCEADALVAYEDHLLIVECRGGAFTYTSPATDFDGYVTSLKNLVLKPATQGKRFRDYLESRDTAPIFDGYKNQIGELRRDDYRHITICPVTLDPFTEIAAQVQHLKKIGVDVGEQPVWAISIDDLRVYADIFSNPLIFLHYIEKRMQAFNSDIVELNDELDHVGLYLRHNDYSAYSEELQGGIFERLLFDGYRSDIDKFFSQRMFNPNFPCPLRQDSHKRFLEIIDILSAQAKPGRAKVASYLLDSAGETRDLISVGIDAELAQQVATHRPKPLSVHGSRSLTVYCWSDHTGPRDATAALAHTRSVLIASGEEAKLLLELQFNGAAAITDVSWEWVTLKDVPVDQVPQLLIAAERLRQRRLAKARAAGKIGRNDLCPCGSGSKFKKCCLLRG